MNVNRIYTSDGLLKGIYEVQNELQNIIYGKLLRKALRCLVLPECKYLTVCIPNDISLLNLKGTYNKIHIGSRQGSFLEKTVCHRWHGGADDCRYPMTVLSFHLSSAILWKSTMSKKGTEAV